MADQAERLLNLALFLAGSREPVTAAACRARGLGYPEGQDDAAFERMFERDKAALRDAGLPIVVIARGETEAYALDSSAYAPPLALTAEEVAVLGAAGAAMLSDPSFPLAEDLRFALVKVAPAAEIGAPAAAGRLADEDSAAQGEAAAVLATAVSARKRVRFGYRTADGREGDREVEPYGLYLREGRWYLVGRDTGRDAVRTFTLARVSRLEVDRTRPRSPDFERPDGFDVAAYAVLPFQYGSATTEATVRFAPDAAWRARRLAAGQGTLEPQPDGAVTWRVPVSDERRFFRWLIESGLGLTLAGPKELCARLAEGLRAVVTAHGR